MSETKQKNPVLLSINYQLPKNTSELRQASEKIQNIKKEVSYLKRTTEINGFIHTTIYEEIVGVLDWVGRMSTCVFDIRDDLESKYENAYPKAPRLAYKLFEEHYSKLHHPYSIIKNRCYTLLEELDFIYINKHKKNPPNWKI